MQAGKRRCEWFGILAMALGLSLLFCSMYLVIGNLLEDQRARAYGTAIEQKLDNQMQKSPMAEYLENPEFIPDYKLNPEMAMPVAEIDGYGYIGELHIPVLGLELAIQDNWSYEGLKLSPCRYTGSAYLGDMTIVAHNYKSHFGNLKNLQPGDEVVFTDIDNNRFEYQVSQVQEIDPYMPEQVTDSGYDLVLCTCTLGGATRIAVYCESK